MPVSDIEVEDVKRCLDPIWHEKTETAKRVRQRIESVIGYAIVHKYRDNSNPATWKATSRFVALSDVAIQLISAIPRAGQYVFLGGKIDKPLSDNAMLSVLRRMERTDVTVHGFRSTFRDYIGEETGLFIVIHNHETRRKQMSNKKLPKKPQLSGSRDRLHCCGIPILCFYRKIAKRSWFQAHQARLRGVNV